MYGFTSIKLTVSATAGPPGYECYLLYMACIVALVLSGPVPGHSTLIAFEEIGLGFEPRLSQVYVPDE
jgi:hypothetical protein